MADHKGVDCHTGPPPGQSTVDNVVVWQHTTILLQEEEDVANRRSIFQLIGQEQKVYNVHSTRPLTARRKRLNTHIRSRLSSQTQTTLTPTYS